MMAPNRGTDEADYALLGPGFVTGQQRPPLGYVQGLAVEGSGADEPGLVVEPGDIDHGRAMRVSRS